jgi:hypothetical protein
MAFAQTFTTATGLPTTSESNFSTKIQRLGNGNLILLHAQVSPTSKLQFYSSSNNGSTRNALSSIAQTNSAYGGDVIVLANGDVLSAACNYTTANNFYRSTDDGATRTNTLTPATSRCLHADFVQLANGDVLVALGNYSNAADTVYRSTNNGVTWSLLYTFPATSTYKLDMEQLASGDLILASIAPNGNNPRNRIRRSADNGVTWTLAQSGTTPVGYDAAVTQASDGSVIVSFAKAGNVNNIYRSTNNGVTWVAGGIVWGATTYYGTDLLTLDNGKIILSLTDGATKNLYQSADHGLTWTAITRPIPIATNAYHTELFEYYTDEFLISDPHWGNVPHVYKYIKPEPPAVSNITWSTICDTLTGINGIGESDTNNIFYEIEDTVANTIVSSGTTSISSLTWSDTLSSALWHGSYELRTREYDIISYSDVNDISFDIVNCMVWPQDVLTGFLVESVVDDWLYVPFTTGYSITPVVLATPQTQSNGENYPIPRVRNVTTAGFELSVCLDSALATCDPNPNPEDIAIFVVDMDKVAMVDGMDAGIMGTATNGANTALTYNKTFLNVPYIYTTSQTYSQGVNNMAPIAWVDGLTLTTANFIGCVHQSPAGWWSVDVCTAWQPNEQIGRLAIDPTTISFTGYDRGTNDISNSDWTNISFTPTYVNPPLVMVTQNDDDGGQDPQYPWARNITTTAAQYRYCEQDGNNVCNSHTSEWVRRFSLPAPDRPEACLTGVVSHTFTGTRASLPTPQVIEQQFDDYLILREDPRYHEPLYTTVSISAFTGDSGGIIPATAAEIRASTLDTISGGPDTFLSLATGTASYQTFDTPITRYDRVQWYTINGGDFGTKPRLRVNIPAYTQLGTYHAIITHTIYGN